MKGWSQGIWVRLKFTPRQKNCWVAHENAFHQLCGVETGYAISSNCLVFAKNF